MEASYALVDKKGRVRSKSSVPILSVPKGQRISYRSDTIHTGTNYGPVLQYAEGDCNGKAVYFIANTYHIEVVGTNPESVERVIRQLELALGGKDITPRFPKLPQLPSVLQRIKFLWDFVVRGRVKVD